MKNTIVVSAFPACGKSYIYNKRAIACLDSDSSKFRWTNINGNRVRNPEFPFNYITHIMNSIQSGKYAYIFVSSHTETRDALKKAGIPYVLVYPDRSLLNEWVKRCQNRKNNGFPIEVLVNNWNNWLDSCEIDRNYGIKCITLQSGQYLSDIINYIR